MRIAVTGSRPPALGGYSNYKNFSKIRDHMKDFLNKAPEGELILLSGGAQGIDQLWIEAGLSLSLKVEAVLPFKGYMSKWPANSRKFYSKLLDRCDQIYYTTTGNEPGAFQKRNEHMVDMADIVVAYWNGSEGGTKNCMDYAFKQKKLFEENIFNIDEIID